MAETSIHTKHSYCYTVYFYLSIYLLLFCFFFCSLTGWVLSEQWLTLSCTQTWKSPLQSRWSYVPHNTLKTSSNSSTSQKPGIQTAFKHIKTYIRALRLFLCCSGQCHLCDHSVCCLYVLPVYYLLCSITESRLLCDSSAPIFSPTLAPGQLPITSYGDQFFPESPLWADAFSTDTWTLLGLVNKLLIVTLHQSLDKNRFAAVYNIKYPSLLRLPQGPPLWPLAGTSVWIM